ncbi:MAG: hypothetical protein JRG76_16075 [Deltaproteobacteria bacterium]|nr:hypothetical protein [Deltaproteobacteria bacterium]MBW2416017.1 hypothetical protein [Deltaproteobacteria bacterium]
MTWQRSLQSAVKALKKEETALQKQLDLVQGKIAELDEMSRSNTGTPAAKRGPRRLSPAGRAAISRAAKKRWARYRADQRSTGAKRKARG